MHTSARAHMQLSVDTYLTKSRHYRVLDFGSQAAGDGHTHREVLVGYDVDYVGVDVVPGENVDVVMTKPYRVPMKSNSVDLVITGSAFEHIPFMWASFLEISRVVKPGGLIFLTAPSRGHIHFTVDCWRYYRRCLLGTTRPCVPASAQHALDRISCGFACGAISIDPTETTGGSQCPGNGPGSPVHSVPTPAAATSNRAHRGMTGS